MFVYYTVAIGVSVKKTITDSKFQQSMGDINITLYIIY